jgi:hypothetical protein
MTLEHADVPGTVAARRIRLPFRILLDLEYRPLGRDENYITMDLRMTETGNADISYSVQFIVLQAAGSAENEASEALTQTNVR